MKTLFLNLFLVAASVLLSPTTASHAEYSDMCYHHQQVQYSHMFRPVGECDQICDIIPFVSPDNTLEAYLTIVTSAKSKIQVFTPAFDPWIKGCLQKFCQLENACTGCSVDRIRFHERFPLFKALIVAMKERGVSVEILTNNFSVPTCKDSASLLDWLFVAGASIKYYGSTSFVHAKSIIADDGDQFLVSSVNFSPAGFLYNREGGILVSGCGDCRNIRMFRDVFAFDWKNGRDYQLTSSLTSDQISEIQTQVPVRPSSIAPYSDLLQTMQGKIVSSFVTPDFGRESLFKEFERINKTISVYMYEITDQ